MAAVTIRSDFGAQKIKEKDFQTGSQRKKVLHSVKEICLKQSNSGRLKIKVLAKIHQAQKK